MLPPLVIVALHVETSGVHATEEAEARDLAEDIIFDALEEWSRRKSYDRHGSGPLLRRPLRREVFHHFCTGDLLLHASVIGQASSQYVKCWRILSSIRWKLYPISGWAWIHMSSLCVRVYLQFRAQSSLGILVARQYEVDSGFAQTEAEKRNH